MAAARMGCVSGAIVLLAAVARAAPHAAGPAEGAFFQSVQYSEDAQALAEEVSKRYLQHPRPVAKKAPRIVGSARPPSVEGPSDAVKAAFLESIENDEETQALAEEVNKRYSQQKARVIRGASGSVGTSPTKRLSEAVQTAALYSIESGEEMQALAEEVNGEYSRQSAQLIKEGP
uniref:PS II complex 12 kDa extrinsic protein n=1 Tax=Zooxanthella nutricula TaxID=1333877 RepID=A0A7S2NFS3_9DINO